jgi:predicted nucleic acid-binding protein
MNMPNIVIDTSAMIEILLNDQSADVALRRRVMFSRLAAPELFDIEAASVLRRLVRCGAVAELAAASALADIGNAPVARAPHRPLMGRVWELRHSVGAYDAAYIALAEYLDVPLVTCDAKLAGSNGHDAKIELFPIS